MAALIANPKTSNGKRVSFVGVLRFQFDKFAVFPSTELARIEDMPSAITGGIPTCVTEEQFSKLDALDGRYVRVSGVFDSSAPGYGGFAAGSLNRVYEIAPAEPSPWGSMCEARQGLGLRFCSRRARIGGAIEDNRGQSRAIEDTHDSSGRNEGRVEGQIEDIHDQQIEDQQIEANRGHP
jgi:hypothetical protein